MHDLVRITDVSPRDGLQNEPRTVPTRLKVELVRSLCEARVDEIEISSFVSPKWVPQLADAAEVFASLRNQKPEGISFSALVPNEKGLQAALAVNQNAGERLIDKVSIFTAASETFSAKNTNATIAQTIERFKPVIDRAKEAGIRVRGYVSCIIACPFEGPIPPERVTEVSARLLDIGIDELDLGDTIGAATPDRLRDLLLTVRDRLGDRLDITGEQKHHTPIPTIIHLHDTNGLAASCVPVALDLGVRWFDGSAGGLGGCPYASTPGKRAPGNISTLSLVEAIERHGLRTRVNKDRLAAASTLARRLLDSEDPTPGPQPC
ncbi:MAG: hydroxymethylglutaryl-CoA lyase [Phycisphaeraceae bacterium]|nr:hydroxymethylglutaryl-CoA lyase [Phycisphaeraceae bacterium]